MAVQDDDREEMSLSRVRVGVEDGAKVAKASAESCVRSKKRHQTWTAERCSDGAEVSQCARLAIVSDPNLQTTCVRPVVGQCG